MYIYIYIERERESCSLISEHICQNLWAEMNAAIERVLQQWKRCCNVVVAFLVDMKVGNHPEETRLLVWRTTIYECICRNVYILYLYLYAHIWG